MNKFFKVIMLLLFLPSLSLSAEPSRELLLFQEIPTVFTVSKKEQTISESPSAVSIITDEDIRAYGAINIPDLLRMVPGVDVLAISATDYNVNIRGFNKDATHKLLVLIDGRSVNLDFMGIVLWESLPVTMGEIKRIEIVKGPGSAIWGGNAYSGIINIVTRRPVEALGTTASVSYGEKNTQIGSVIHGDRKGSTSYMISAGWKQEDNWDDNNWGQSVVRGKGSLAMETKKGNFTLEQALSNSASLTLSGGVVRSYGEVLTAADVYRRDNTSSHLKLDYQRGWLRFHTYWNGLDTGIKETINSGDFKIKTDTYDTELQGVFDAGNSNSIVTGVSVRVNTVDSELLSGHNQQDIWGLYLQDDLKLTEKLTLTAGARYDQHPLVGWNLSPRAAMIYTPKEGHTLRLSYTTAYSLPTFVESYLSRDISIIQSRGNRDVKPGKISSWELGYNGAPHERVKTTVELFYNELEDFITFLPTPDAVLLFGNTYSKYSFFNRGKYKASGGEAGLDFYIADDLVARANYSYQFIWNDEAGTRVSYSPLSKANAELRYDPKRGVNAAAWVNYVGETNWSSSAQSEDWLPPSTLTTRIGTDPMVPAYLLLNIKTGYRFTEDTELYLSAFNLLDDRHREFIAGDEVGRRVTANLATRF